MITQKIQRCVACGEPTGRCEEDSIYLPPKDPNGSDLGPLCEACCDERDLRAYAAQAVAAEREACADICDQHASAEGIAQRCAAAIRARGQKESPPV